MRLIDADNLVALLNKKYGDDDINESVLYLVGAISGASTVDAVSVVRCKDCEYKDGDVCEYSAVYVHPNGFCNWGRRRNEEGK